MVSTLSIEADLQNLPVIRRFITETGAELAVNPEAIECLILAADESVTNIILHGYRGRPGTIEVQIEREEGALVIRLRDQSPSFDPTRIPPSEPGESFEQTRSGGMGIRLIRHFTDRLTYRVTPEGNNELSLWKTIK